MKLHIDMDDELVADVDALAGRRGRRRFLREAVLAARTSASAPLSFGQLAAP